MARIIQALLHLQRRVAQSIPQFKLCIALIPEPKNGDKRRQVEIQKRKGGNSTLSGDDGQPP
jgi:hypothetical protein